MKLKFKEIVEEHWEIIRDVFEDIYYAIEDLFVDIIPDFFTDMFEVVISDRMRCLNVAGKIFALPFLIIILIVSAIAFAIVFLCMLSVFVLIFVMGVVIGIPLCLISIIIRWIYQRTLGPLGRMLFVKKECKENY